jgi:hypothetical protein
MNAQYELLTKILKLLKTTELRLSRMVRVEYLIYRIKILLLRHERSSAAELNRLCPIADLEGLHRLVAESTGFDASQTLQLQLQLEESLEQIALRFEGALPAAKAAPAAVMASSSYGV